MKEKKYMVALGEETLQVDEEGLRELVASGKVGPDTLVACEETGWRFVRYEELRAIKGWTDEVAIETYLVWRGRRAYEVTGEELIRWIEKGKVGPLTKVKPEDGPPQLLVVNRIWRLARWRGRKGGDSLGYRGRGVSSLGGVVVLDWRGSGCRRNP